MRMKNRALGALALVALAAAACGEKTPPVVEAPMPPPAMDEPAPAPVVRERVEEPVPLPPPEPVAADDVGSRSLDDLNRNSPLAPVYFEYDSTDLNAAAQLAVRGNADVLRRYPTWTVTIEGHCDERGTAEYNLALGERRAAAARRYLESLGVAPDRLRIVSYGKEFPFDPGHDESAWQQNRRAHFVITSR
ncbi:MAG: peptidoglycan-associated lipoprotein Pal [Acidimicrobiia bacterium]|nr:peptidoglycan-associated lipoprotein Pal [Acidimicrobiia bacterium]